MRLIPPEPLVARSSDNLSLRSSIDELETSSLTLTGGDLYKMMKNSSPGKDTSIKVKGLPTHPTKTEVSPKQNGEKASSQEAAEPAQPIESSQKRTSKLKIALATSASTSVEDLLRKNDHQEQVPRKSDEYAKIKSLCKEFGVPDPSEMYIVARDFSVPGKVNNTQFSSKMPKGLGKWVDPDEFSYTIGKINYIFAKAEKVTCGMIMCGILKYLTCGVCRNSRLKRAIKEVKDFIVEENQVNYHPKGFHIVDPAARGLRHIEIRSISYYSIKYFLEHEDEITLTESEATTNPSQAEVPFGRATV